MQRSRVEVEAELDRLGPHDFSMSNRLAKGMERLRVLLPELVAVSAPSEATRTILKLIERLSDAPDLGECELGTPGPMVHELEGLAGYEHQLIESVARFPTPLTVWMVNRLMNSLDKRDERWARLLDLLKQAALATRAARGAREDAKDFVLYQETL